MHGAILCMCSLAGLYRHEHIRACMHQALARNVREENCSHPGDVDDGLVHISCQISESSLPEWTPRNFAGMGWLDGAFCAKGAKVLQDVSMYQCTEMAAEHSQPPKYQMTWSSMHIDSAKFQAWTDKNAFQALLQGCGPSFKSNPKLLVHPQTLEASEFYAGGFDVSRYHGQLSVTEPIELKQGKYYFQHGMFTRSMCAISHIVGTSSCGKTAVHVHGNMAETCVEGALKLGCLRISYFKSAATHVSVLAAKVGNSFKAWEVTESWSCKPGNRRMDLFEEGARSAEELVSKAMNIKRLWSWCGRTIFFMSTILGIHMFLSPIRELAHLARRPRVWFLWLPFSGLYLRFFGNVASGCTDRAIGFLAFSAGSSLALMAFSASWFLLRPAYCLPAILFSIVLLFFTVNRMVLAQRASIRRAEALQQLIDSKEA